MLAVELEQLNSLTICNNGIYSIWVMLIFCRIL